IDGQALRTVSYPEDSQTRWAQAYEVPAAGGTLALSHREPMAVPMLVLSGLVLLISVLLAIPVPSTRRLANYRNDSYRIRETRRNPQEVADGEQVLAAAQPGTSQVQEAGRPR